MKTPNQAEGESNHDPDELRKAKNREAAARYRERNRETAASALINGRCNDYPVRE